METFLAFIIANKMWVILASGLWCVVGYVYIEYRMRYLENTNKGPMIVEIILSGPFVWYIIIRIGIENIKMRKWRNRRNG